MLRSVTDWSALIRRLNESAQPQAPDRRLRMEAPPSSHALRAVHEFLGPRATELQALYVVANGVSETLRIHEVETPITWAVWPVEELLGRNRGNGRSDWIEFADAGVDGVRFAIVSSDAESVHVEWPQEGRRERRALSVAAFLEGYWSGRITI
jgi:hypothetical protein